MVKKVCCSCKVSKEVSEFYNRNNSKDGLHNSCKDCCNQSAAKSRRRRMKEDKPAWDKYNRDYRREWNKKHPEKVKEYGRIHQEKFRIKSWKLKKEAVDYLGGKCSKCGYDKSLAALDFHHLDPSKKEDGIGNLIWKNHSMNFTKLKKELDKCVILCKNCHAVEHNPEY